MDKWTDFLEKFKTYLKNGHDYISNSEITLDSLMSDFKDTFKSNYSYIVIIKKRNII